MQTGQPRGGETDRSMAIKQWGPSTDRHLEQATSGAICNVDGDQRLVAFRTLTPTLGARQKQNGPPPRGGAGAEVSQYETALRQCHPAPPYVSRFVPEQPTKGRPAPGGRLTGFAAAYRGDQYRYRNLQGDQSD